MKKLYRSSLILAGLTCMFYSCDSNKDDTAIPTDEEVEYIVIDANTTDVPVKPSKYDEVDGIFRYTENYFLTSGPPSQFTIDKGYFMSSYIGKDTNGPHFLLQSSKINGQPMCTETYINNICDSSRPSTSWNLYGNQHEVRNLKWEYLNSDKSKGYRVVMTDVPEAAKWHAVPTRISFDDEIKFQFERNSVKDSIIVGLLIVPKEGISKVHPSPIINGTRQIGYLVKPGETSFTLTKANFSQSAFGPPTAADSVFLNLRTTRHVIKVIDNREILISYVVNEIRPVTVDW
ncbi:hypothetical protein Q4E40_13360 [Pontibacter sp. BT731]|uniref:hypothetical protein n=1 Tax=Pontibacter coccineus TaxID=3063328 RepID=UPI0026E2A414|nr:hypothetical protein [Pontibacter sp. BT731]MDO6391121.1 hypothetical protein [Pontibacter sp. BT731]